MRFAFLLLLFLNFTASAQVSEKMAGGIGIRFKIDAKIGYPVIHEIMPNSAADKAGLQPNDIILKIDSISAKGFELEDVVVLVRGPVGEKVKLLVKRGEKEMIFDVVRQKMDFD